MAEWIVEANDRADLINGLCAIGEELVRCRDCKWWDKDNGFDDKGYCDLLDSYWRPDEYCSSSERREE